VTIKAVGVGSTKEEHPCPVCGRPVVGRKFCSHKCYGVYRSLHYRGENHPFWKGRVTLVCLYCGKEFQVPLYRKETAKFCSRSCRARWWGEQWRTGKKKQKHVRLENRGRYPKTPEHRRKLREAAIRNFQNEEYLRKYKEGKRRARLLGKEDPKKHDRECLKVMEELAAQGFRVVPVGLTNIGYPVPDLVAIRGENIKVFAVEVDTRKPTTTKLKKYDGFPFYDDIIWVISRIKEGEKN